MIASKQVRILLDRNRNGLEGRPFVNPGQAASVGLYWDSVAGEVVAIDTPRGVDRHLILLSRDRDVSYDALVRQMAMGGGGHTGRAVAYHEGVSPAAH
ncbi:MAG: hypothetical protein EPO26_09755 [Chloroflexota bacterium]|nr:MAG: hypothetical protein EPO26_09755 [Chloroflexota bacterium]